MNIKVLEYNDSHTLNAGRERLLSAAYKLFLSQGIAETTMNQIADGAGISRRTIYNYYESKDHLAQDIQIIVLERTEWFEQFSRAIGSVNTDVLSGLARRLLTEQLQDFRYISIFDCYFSAGYPGRKYIDYLNRKYEKVLNIRVSTVGKIKIFNPAVEDNLGTLLLFQLFLAYLQRILLRNGDGPFHFQSYKQELTLFIHTLFHEH